MNMTIGQRGNTTQPTASTAGPGTADTAAVDAFNAQMGISPEGTAVKQATDEQIAALPQGDVQRLREKWGADEVGFREEAYGLWEFSQKFQDDDRADRYCRTRSSARRSWRLNCVVSSSSKSKLSAISPVHRSGDKIGGLLFYIIYIV